jgi:hypothetical protein
MLKDKLTVLLKALGGFFNSDPWDWAHPIFSIPKWIFSLSKEDGLGSGPLCNEIIIQPRKKKT